LIDKIIPDFGEYYNENNLKEVEKQDDLSPDCKIPKKPNCECDPDNFNCHCYDVSEECACNEEDSECECLDGKCPCEADDSDGCNCKKPLN